MREPRCGMPDFYRNSKNLPFRAISRYSWFPDHQKWYKYNLSYTLDNSVRAEVKQPLVNAMSQWTYVTPFRFHYVSRHGDADIKISFAEENHGDGFPFEGALAQAFAPTDGRIHFAAHRSWSYRGAANIYTFDLQTVGMHELGHALGLGHNQDYWAVMYPTVNPGQIRHLQSDDIDGIKAEGFVSFVRV